MALLFSIVARLCLLLFGAMLIRLAWIESDHAPSIGFWLAYLLVASAHFAGLLGWLRLPAPRMRGDYAVLIAYVLGTFVAFVALPNLLRGGMPSRVSAYLAGLLVWATFATPLLLRVVRRRCRSEAPIS